jgi:hypothetical protein
MIARKSKAVLLALTLAVAASCSPMTYRPIVYPGSIDDYSKYNADLDACEHWSAGATSEDPGIVDGAVGGAVAGATVGTILGAIVGAFLGDAGSGAAIGAALGGAQGGMSGAGMTYAAKKQRETSAIYTCLEARGYRVSR